MSEAVAVLTNTRNFPDKIKEKKKITGEHKMFNLIKLYKCILQIITQSKIFQTFFVLMLINIGSWKVERNQTWKVERKWKRMDENLKSSYKVVIILFWIWVNF